jgi:hypothetical protein
MIGNCKYLIFPLADRDRSTVNLNDRAPDLDLFRKLFMTIYDIEITLHCENLQAISIGNFKFHLAKILLDTGSNP